MRHKMKSLEYTYDDEHNACFVFINWDGTWEMDEAYLVRDDERDVEDEELLLDTPRWDELTDIAWREVYYD